MYKSVFKKDASSEQVVKSGKIFGWILAVVSMSLAPLLAGQDSIFGYLQKMNGIYFIPILAVVLIGMLTRRVPPFAAKFGLIVGILTVACGFFIPPLALIVDSMHEFNFLGLVFAWLIVIMLGIGEAMPLKEEWAQEDVNAVDMTPWKHARVFGIALIAIVLSIYIFFADLTVLAN